MTAHKNPALLSPVTTRCKDSRSLWLRTGEEIAESSRWRGFCLAADGSVYGDDALPCVPVNYRRTSFHQTEVSGHGGEIVRRECRVRQLL